MLSLFLCMRDGDAFARALSIKAELCSLQAKHARDDGVYRIQPTWQVLHLIITSLLYTNIMIWTALTVNVLLVRRLQESFKIFMISRYTAFILARINVFL